VIEKFPFLGGGLGLVVMCGVCGWVPGTAKVRAASCVYS
jgi:hypothetical protein